MSASENVSMRLDACVPSGFSNEYSRNDSVVGEGDAVGEPAEGAGLTADGTDV
jgi:hypothetical protein